MRRILFVILTLGLAASCSQSSEATDTSVAKQTAESESATPAKLSVEEQIRFLEEQCSLTAEARTKRHAEKALYERLGGEEKIHALTREIVRLHLQNDAIKHYFDGLDTDAVADRVAEFVITGTGGPERYAGPDLRSSHEHMALTDADFLSAGGDVIQAMKNLGYGEEEIDEVVCILVSLRDQVILE